MSNRPTPAEAMALWHSLDRRAVTRWRRDSQRPRPIGANAISQWKKQGWQRFAKPPRTDMPTPAEVQAIWNSLENPSLRKVANAFKAQGRPVCTRTIWKWKQAGVTRYGQNVVAKATKAIQTTAPAVPAPTGGSLSISSGIQGAEPRSRARGCSHE